MAEKESLLLVNDDRQTREHCTRELLRRGFAVVPVWHTRQALEAVRCRAFDAAIVRLPLPMHSLDQFARQLHMQVARLRVVVVVDDNAIQNLPPECQGVTYVCASERVEGILKALSAKNGESNGCSMTKPYLPFDGDVVPVRTAPERNGARSHRTMAYEVCKSN